MRHYFDFGKLVSYNVSTTVQEIKESGTSANTTIFISYHGIKMVCRYELGLEKPDPKRAIISAVTIGGSYAIGGMVPLSPYFILPTVKDALYVSIGVTLIALFIFGYVKGVFTGANVWKSALTTTIIGALASSAAFGIALLVNQ